MKKKLLLIFFLLTFLFSEENIVKYYDFGTVGQTYSIQEKSMINEFNENKWKIKKYLNPQNIRKKTIKAIKNFAKFESSLSFCQKDQKKQKITDYVILPVDIVNPFGRVVYKKGEKIRSNLPEGKTLDICFVGGNLITVQNQINFFQKKYKQCVFLVSGVNVLKLRRLFPGIDIYPSSLSQENRFGLKCYPAHLHFYKDKKDIEYFNYEQFKN